MLGVATDDLDLDELHAYMRRYERAKAVVDQRGYVVQAAIARNTDPKTGKLRRGAAAEIVRVSGLSRTHVERLQRGETSGTPRDHADTPDS